MPTNVLSRLPMAVRVGAGVLTLSGAGAGFIVMNEGSHQRVYLDSVGYPTVCVGHMDKTMVVGTLYTQAQCDKFFLDDTDIAIRTVRTLVKVKLYQSEFDTLVDFVIQYGPGRFAKSTLLKQINAGNYALAALEFTKWRFAGGKDCKIRKNNCYGVYDRALRRATLFVSEHEK